MVESAKIKRQKLSNYTGYKISSNNETVAELKEIIAPEEFFDKFVKLRRPVKLSKALNDFLDIESFKIENITEYLLYDDDLQIERKFKCGFGSGLKREKFGLEELINKFKDGIDEYYLTTQYEFDEPDYKEEDDQGEKKDELDESEVEEDDDEGNEEEAEVMFDKFSDNSSIDFNNLQDDFEDEYEEELDDPILNKELNLTRSEVAFRLKELLQPPLTNLYNKLPIQPKILSGLVPQQINLWMGYSDNETKSFDFDNNQLDLGKYIPGKGSSSGLHHDHADNLYILVSGIKRFTLYSPNDVDKLYTVGAIYKVFNNGLIDYEIDENAPNWKHIRDDGAMVTEIAKWKLDNENFSNETKEELLNIIRQEESKRNNLPKRKSFDPPSFSKIPPALLHIDEFLSKDFQDKLVNFANKFFPGFLELNKLTVWLKPGEMLYLPCGWFHEVSSFSSKEVTNDPLGNVHIALNYWYVPPNGESFDNCYNDNYWLDDWERTKECLKLAKEGKVQLDI